ncbi:hypothetical protein KW798_00085 [Candidatus Parcubacteria bacterium]|nr:hypothetical protein [Candidatus Parcubacteria bacterium]
MPFIAIFAAIVIGLGGSVSLAAERSQPGDTLYPVKTHVNDEVRAMVTGEAHTDVEANSGLNLGVDVDASVR